MTHNEEISFGDSNDIRFNDKVSIPRVCAWVTIEQVKTPGFYPQIRSTQLVCGLYRANQAI